MRRHLRLNKTKMAFRIEIEEIVAELETKCQGRSGNVHELGNIKCRYIWLCAKGTNLQVCYTLTISESSRYRKSTLLTKNGCA